MLEQFLDRAVRLKEKRLSVIDGINRLDDIARSIEEGFDMTQNAGLWFAEHNRWLSASTLRPADCRRIGSILGKISSELSKQGEKSAASYKIDSEVSRWTEATSGSVAQKQSTSKITLKRQPEAAVPEPVKPSIKPIRAVDTLEDFSAIINRLPDLFADMKSNRVHLLTVLDDSLKSAHLQKNKEALLLSALIIYFLKQENYKIEPYVRRLKEAEQLQQGGQSA